MPKFLLAHPAVWLPGPADLNRRFFNQHTMRFDALVLVKQEKGIK